MQMKLSTVTLSPGMPLSMEYTSMNWPTLSSLTEPEKRFSGQ